MRVKDKKKRRRNSLFSHGEIWIGGAGGALCLCAVMVVGLLSLILYKGSQTFWPVELAKVTLLDGRFLMGEESRQEDFKLSLDKWQEYSQDLKDKIYFSTKTTSEKMPENLICQRKLYRTGNFEITNEHFNWVEDHEVRQIEFPQRAVVLERIKNGRFYGELQSINKLEKKGFKRVVTSSVKDLDRLWNLFEVEHHKVLTLNNERHHLEKSELGKLNRKIEGARLEVTGAKLNYGVESKVYKEAQANLKKVDEEASESYQKIIAQISEIREKGRSYSLTVKIANGDHVDIFLSDVVRAYLPNKISLTEKFSIYFSRWSEFLCEDPREANSEGGVFPAIFGTVVMTLIMSIMVVPFGVMTALYLSEYAKSGPIVSVIRIAVNNLAGVPSIVFGVFGLGFFCYFVGAYIDGGPEKGLQLIVWPRWLWWVSIGFLVVMALAAIKFSRFNKDNKGKKKSHVWLGRLATVLWLASVILFVCILIYTPYFNGFFSTKLSEGSPTFGTGGILWAAMTLALLTLPVVIVATEEAISAVPKSMREGSYACGASVWQTIYRIVLPRATPGIMTGLILAMARGAGEVAPLMLVGAVKLAPELPLDQFFPFVHPERSFMHLGFHIYDVGFQSQNSEAAKPMVFTTTLLLILIITMLNLSAIWLRSKLKKRFISQHF